MQVSIEKIDNIKRKLTINVPVEQMERFYQQEVDHFIRYAKPSNMNKFRLIEAKKKYVEMYHGAEVLEMALDKVIEGMLQQVIDQEEFILAGTPYIERTTFIKGQPWEFTALLDVLPEIKSVRFSLEELEKPVVFIQDKDIDYVIKQLLKSQMKLEETNQPATEQHLALDEAFIKRIGITSGKIEDLRDEVKQHLEQEARRAIKARIKEQVYCCLLEQNSIDLPAFIIEREALAMHKAIDQANHQRNKPQDGKKEMEILYEMAKKRIILGILVEKCTKRDQIVVKKEEITQRINEIAEAFYEDKIVAIKELASNYLEDIQTEILEDRIVEKLIENIPVIEKRMSYAELKGIQYSE